MPNILLYETSVTDIDFGPREKDIFNAIPQIHDPKIIISAEPERETEAFPISGAFRMIFPKAEVFVAPTPVFINNYPANEATNNPDTLKFPHPAYNFPSDVQLSIVRTELERSGVEDPDAKIAEKPTDPFSDEAAMYAAEMMAYGVTGRHVDCVISLENGGLSYIFNNETYFTRKDGYSSTENEVGLIRPAGVLQYFDALGEHLNSGGVFICDASQAHNPGEQSTYQHIIDFFDPEKHRMYQWMGGRSPKEISMEDFFESIGLCPELIGTGENRIFVLRKQ